MKLPRLFHQIHQREIEDGFRRHGPVFRIIPKEPLGAASLDRPLDTVDLTVTVVTIRCINDRGSVRVEAYSDGDLKVAQEWASRHRDTPPEDFTWFPELGEN
jgi:hypothetical protein